jgi:ribosome recycling factor
MVSETLKNLEQKMKTSIKAFQADLATVRTGHASPALVEHVKVEYMGIPLIRLPAYRRQRLVC